MFNNLKKWVKNEKSQITAETGMLIALVVVGAIVLGPIIWPKLKSGYTIIMDRFENAAKSADVASWN